MENKEWIAQSWLPLGGVFPLRFCRCWHGTLAHIGPQRGDPRLSGPPSGQGNGGLARTRDRWVPADLRAESLTTVPPTGPDITIIKR
ncbi:hypothetical protein PoB_005806400 [Plakobranchus ocellatus]|uniref:Uncharacterized protein n=1 Tax=Plakobranchus ocellatus TaxID=259542 RepID=A0AAV4CKT9_9GAST|nr:hypothetical protein PoB_005806400 [Plakobranchus ocellatus]